MNRSTFILVLTLPLLAACSISKDISKSEVKALSDKIETASASFKGVAIREMGKESMMLGHNADQLFTPASNIKLLTLLASKTLLGDSLSIFEYYSSGNALHIRGNANPVLLHPEFTFLNEEWMQDIQKRGLDSIVIHHREIVTGRYMPGWAWDDYPYFFQAEIHSLPLFGNSLWMDWNRQDGLLQMYPDHIAKYADVEVNPGSGKLKVEREEFSNSFIIKVGDNAPSQKKRSVPFIMDSYTTSEILRDTLPLKIRYSYEMPNVQWKAFTSVPLDSVYRRMMLHSDNFIAEQLLLASSSKISDTLDPAKAIEFVLKKYFPEYQDKVSWVDGSGLSRYNLITPAFTLMVWEKLLTLLKEDDRKDHFARLGKEGTVREDYKKLYPYNIYGKSGSLKHHYTLSGYFYTEDARIMLYCIMLDNSLTPQSIIKEDVGSLLQALYDSL